LGVHSVNVLRFIFNYTIGIQLRAMDCLIIFRIR
jgi:hypothetical protein